MRRCASQLNVADIGCTFKDRGFFLQQQLVSTIREANISYYARRGYLLLVRSSSWRCGGVVSAKSADISDLVIKALGRWASDAWITYGSATTNLDIRGAAKRMREAADAESPHAPRDPSGGGLASTAATEATTIPPGLQLAVATQPVPHVVGGTLWPATTNSLLVVGRIPS